jgi:hypothetical protein
LGNSLLSFFSYLPNDLFYLSYPETFFTAQGFQTHFADNSQVLGKNGCAFYRQQGCGNR